MEIATETAQTETEVAEWMQRTVTPHDVGPPSVSGTETMMLPFEARSVTTLVSDVLKDPGQAHAEATKICAEEGMTLSEMPIPSDTFSQDSLADGLSPHLDEPPPHSATAAPSTPPSVSVPPEFADLVNLLNEARSRSEFERRVYFKHMAPRMRALNPDILKATGVRTFPDYVELAQEAGLVDVGRDNSLDWMELRPAYHSTTVPRDGNHLPVSLTVPPAPASTTHRPYVPSNFAHLVDILDRTRGKVTQWHPVANELRAWDPNLFHDTTGGPKKFNVYVKYAERAGLIETGSDGGTPWMALKPEYYGA
ncbi:hypothetical protein NM688_g9020 [Phlebia brevispora]|uniref:Uncharacterized protein n=1 Tax=Phlebia brevispora TaxID=194682 RepID=A0ACC1RNW7_9APHY|nr:hypothetical protein NM688_g9020 [Phlebia brevispora]